MQLRRCLTGLTGGSVWVLNAWCEAIITIGDFAAWVTRRRSSSRPESGLWAVTDPPARAFTADEDLGRITRLRWAIARELSGAHSQVQHRRVAPHPEF